MDEETLALFRVECEALIESLEADLLTLQDAPRDRESIDRVFRSLHTLKGTGAMFGRADIAGFLHAFETAFERVRDGTVPVTRDLIDVSLLARDHVDELLRSGDGLSGDDREGAKILRRLALLPGMSVEEPAPAKAQAPVSRRIAFRMAADTLRLGGRPELVLEELRNLGARDLRAVLDDLPSPETLDPTVLHLRWEGTIDGSVPDDRVREAFLFHEDGLELTITDDVEADGRTVAPDASAEDEPGPLPDAPSVGDRPDPTDLADDLSAGGATEPTPTDSSSTARTAAPPAGLAPFSRPSDAAIQSVRPEARADVSPQGRQGGEQAPARILQAGPPPVTASAPQPRPASLMRVPAERLDEMMDRVGELVIAEARLAQLAHRLADPGLVSVAEDIQRLAALMRDTTMSIRMTPIGTIAGRFRRLVHDLATDLGRSIALEIAGEETELDKTVVERLADPLMHLIRNAADHGLEDPAARTALGKPAQGTIALSARYAGAEVLVTLADDGKGLDRDAIRSRAIERGLIPPGAEIAEQELLGVIFEPGFSTAPAVTELSGRGVGMDVVRRTIDELRGSIEIASEPGHGTTVTLRLPLTLAIIDGLLVEVAGERYVLPLAAIETIVELPPESEDDDGNAFLDVRGRLVPFLRMRSLLQSGGAPGPYQKVVVVGAPDGQVGLVVDRIIGSNQTVIKQLSPLHAGLKAFAGATILGDGSVALILDVTQLVARGRAGTDHRTGVAA